MITSRPVLSVWCPIREGSANRRSPPSSATHRHGWLLCRDGARHANSPAFLITSAFSKFSDMLSTYSTHEAGVEAACVDDRVRNETGRENPGAGAKVLDGMQQPGA